MIEEKEEVRSYPRTDVYPRKMIVKQGTRHFVLDTSDIVYFYSNNKVVYVVDIHNQKYITDKSLLRLEEELDPRLFFKANRTHIISINFIRSFTAHDRNKVKVELKGPQKEQSAVVSQTRVVAFKQWIYQQAIS